MNLDERKEACEKFRKYLNANDAEVSSIAIRFSDSKTLFIGSTESLTEALLLVVADRLGFQIGVKP